MYKFVRILLAWALGSMAVSCDPEPAGIPVNDGSTVETPGRPASHLDAVVEIRDGETVCTGTFVSHNTLLTTSSCVHEHVVLVDRPDVVSDTVHKSGRSPLAVVVFPDHASEAYLSVVWGRAEIGEPAASARRRAPDGTTRLRTGLEVVAVRDDRIWTRRSASHPGQTSGEVTARDAGGPLLLRNGLAGLFTGPRGLTTRESNLDEHINLLSDNSIQLMLSVAEHTRASICGVDRDCLLTPSDMPSAYDFELDRTTPFSEPPAPPEPGAPEDPTLPPDAPLDPAIYRGYEDVLEILDRLAEQIPSMFQLEPYGVSQDGRPLLALEVNIPSADIGPQRRVMLTAATHGDEVITTEVLLRIMEDLSQPGAARDALTDLLKTFDLYFVAVVSPDSRVFDSRFAHGLDPNRNYPGPGTRFVRSPLPSVQHLIDYFDAKQFVGVIDLHSYSEILLLPWGHTLERIPDWDELYGIAQSVAAVAGYDITQLSRWSILGGPSTGCSADCWYHRNGAMAMGIELGTSHRPFLDAEVSAIKEQTFDMILAYLNAL